MESDKSSCWLTGCLVMQWDFKSSLLTIFSKGNNSTVICRRQQYIAIWLEYCVARRGSSIYTRRPLIDLDCLAHYDMLIEESKLPDTHWPTPLIKISKMIGGWPLYIFRLVVVKIGSGVTRECDFLLLFCYSDRRNNLPLSVLPCLLLNWRSLVYVT